MLRGATELKQAAICRETVGEAKILGFSDRKIGRLVRKSEEDVRQFRKTEHIIPCTKQIDTLAAEWPANTNYLYLTYGGTEDDLPSQNHDNVVVLCSGC